MKTSAILPLAAAVMALAACSEATYENHMTMFYPQEPSGRTIYADQTVDSTSVISYDETYEDAEGTLQSYIPSGCGIMTAPGAGRTVYGAVTQLEQADGEFHTYAKNRVPKYVANADGNVRTLTLSARPLMVPNNKNTFISAKSLLTA